MKEQWKPIPGYEGLYEVSTIGRVRSLGRTTTYQQRTRWGGVTTTTRTTPPRMLPGYVLPIWYWVVTLTDSEGMKSLQYIHRLVLLAFRGPAPKGHEGCHYDGDSLNNRLDNLRWDTRAGNVQDTIRHGRHWATNQKKRRKK